MDVQDRRLVGRALATTLIDGWLRRTLDARQQRELALLTVGVRCGVDLDEVSERLTAVGLAT